VRDVHVSANDELGFCSFLYHVGGTLKTGAPVRMWVRATLCCRRMAGRWRIVHDHESRIGALRSSDRTGLEPRS